MLLVQVSKDNNIVINVKSYTSDEIQSLKDNFLKTVDLSSLGLTEDEINNMTDEEFLKQIILGEKLNSNPSVLNLTFTDDEAANITVEKGYIYDATNNTFVAPDVDSLKSEVITILNNMCRLNIEKYYPVIKQRSDMADKEYHGPALLLINIDYTADQIYKTAAEKAIDIMENGTALSDIVSTFPDAEQFHWEQLIKIAVRVLFVQKNKETYYTKKSEIEAITDANTLLGYIHDPSTIDVTWPTLPDEYV